MREFLRMKEAGIHRTNLMSELTDGTLKSCSPSLYINVTQKKEK